MLRYDRRIADIHSFVATLLVADEIPIDPLHISFAGQSLRTLPDLTLPLHTLTLTSNELSDLPPDLPQTLLHLDISRNWFRKIPNLPTSLVSLNGCHNLLRNSGLGTLPEGLLTIDLRFNQNLNKLSYLKALQVRPSEERRTGGA
jgi:Leucine-rich repeat (LRR) protein